MLEWTSTLLHANLVLRDFTRAGLAKRFVTPVLKGTSPDRARASVNSAAVDPSRLVQATLNAKSARAVSFRTFLARRSVRPAVLDIILIKQVNQHASSVDLH